MFSSLDACMFVRRGTEVESHQQNHHRCWPAPSSVFVPWWLEEEGKRDLNCCGGGEGLCEEENKRNLFDGGKPSLCFRNGYMEKK